MICAIPDVVVVWAIRVQVLSLPNTLARTEQLLGTTDGEKKERKKKRENLERVALLLLFGVVVVAGTDNETAGGCSLRIKE